MNSHPFMLIFDNLKVLLSFCFHNRLFFTEGRYVYIPHVHKVAGVRLAGGEIWWGAYEHMQSDCILVSTLSKSSLPVLVFMWVFLSVLRSISGLPGFPFPCLVVVLGMSGPYLICLQTLVGVPKNVGWMCPPMEVSGLNKMDERVLTHGTSLGIKHFGVCQVLSAQGVSNLRDLGLLISVLGWWWILLCTHWCRLLTPSTQYLVD